MKNWFALGLFAFFCFLPGSGRAESQNFIFLSSTIGPIDAGIVPALEDAFEKETGIRVRHVGAGTGAALDIARQCNVDIVLAHAKSLEEKFVQDGFGTRRFPLMYNDFVILGPAEDPAGIKGTKNAAEALKQIAAKQAFFVTRGDKSGTNVAEMLVWEKAGIKPSGSWYHTYEKGATGNVPTLRFTNEKNAYTLMDRATYLVLKKDIKLAVLVENDEILLNFMSLIPVDPKKCPRVNYEDAMTFVAWATSPEKGQKIISDFGKDKYGSALFFPNSDEWKKSAKGRQ